MQIMIKGTIALIRPKNLFLLCFAQYAIKYALLDPMGVSTILDHIHFAILVLATCCIAAAGNIINDIFDVETDTINKPNRVIVGKLVSEKTAYNLYFALTIIGVSLGFFLANHIEKTGLAALFIIISALLYLYASQLKQTVLIGNILISLLVASSIIIVGLFDLFPATTELNQTTQTIAFKKIFDYALFAFMINLLREMVKDIEDIDGDYNSGMRTLPIVIGRDRTVFVVFALSFIPLLSVIYYVVTYLYNYIFVVIYFLLFVVGPMVYFTIKSFNVETKAQLHLLSNVLKIIMFTGVFSILLYIFIF